MWSDMSTRGLLFEWDITVKIKLDTRHPGLVKTDIVVISTNITCSHHDIARQNCSFGTKQSFTHALDIKPMSYSKPSPGMFAI